MGYDGEQFWIENDTSSYMVYFPSLNRDFTNQNGDLTVWGPQLNLFLVGGIPAPLNNDGVRQLGWLFPIEWKNKKWSKPPLCTALCIALSWVGKTVLWPLWLFGQGGSKAWVTGPGEEVSPIRQTLKRINSVNNQDLTQWPALAEKAVDTNPKNW